MQFGFRKTNFSNHALTYLHEAVIKERDGNNSVYGFFIDLPKAFDTVNYSILLVKFEQNGIRRNAFNLINLNLSIKLQYSEQ